MRESYSERVAVTTIGEDGIQKHKKIACKSNHIQCKIQILLTVLSAYIYVCRGEN